MIEVKKLLVSSLARLKGYPRVFREILYGMTLHEMDLELKKERGSLDHLFYAGGLWRSFGITASSPILFDEAFSLSRSDNRKMEKESFKGKRPDRLGIDRPLSLLLERQFCHL